MAILEPVTHVRAKDTLEPRQQVLSYRKLAAGNVFLQVLIKFSETAYFRSEPAWLYAGLLEGDPSISAFIPYPFQLWVGRALHTPMFYVVPVAAKRQVVDIQESSESLRAKQNARLQFFQQRGLDYQVINRESIYARQTEAENWLEMVRSLYFARFLDTGVEEDALIDRVREIGGCELGDIVDVGDRERSYRDEIAILRLLHRGRLCTDLSTRYLDLDSVIQLCS